MCAASQISGLPVRLRELVAWHESRPPFDGVLTIEASEVSTRQLPGLLASAGKPVIVKGYLKGTPLEDLTFEVVRATAGHYFLDPSEKPDLVVQHYSRWVEASTPMLLGDYIDKVVLAQGPFDSEPYKRYRNIRISDHFRQSLGLIRPGFLSEGEVNPPCIWLGRKGSWTGLHTDPNDNFVLAVIGSKRFYLFSPSDLSRLYFGQVGQTAFLRSSIDPRRPDTETYPLYKLANCVTADLNPADLLFLPFGWPHFVECSANAFTYNYWLNSREIPFFKR